MDGGEGVGLRLFADAEDKMNLALADVGGALLVVSQFTLYGDAGKGDARASSTRHARRSRFRSTKGSSSACASRRCKVETGEFGAMMDVELVNDGPVTLWLEREAEAPKAQA